MAKKPKPPSKKGPGKPTRRASEKGARRAALPPTKVRVRKKKHPWVIKDPRAKIPHGWEPPRETAKEARDRIARYFKSFADCVQAHGARARAVVYLNPNDTIDAEVVVDKIPRNYPAFHPSKPDVITDGENCFHDAVEGEVDKIKADYFIYGAIDILDYRGRDTADRRMRGYNVYGTFWYRANHVFDMFEALRARAEYTQKKRGKATRVRIRMHWNVLNLPPGALVRQGKELAAWQAEKKKQKEAAKKAKAKAKAEAKKVKKTKKKGK